MPTESINVSGLIPATPKAIYDAWLDSVQHSKFTGGKATVEPKIGGKHTSWDGYISGKTLALEPYKRIIQTWRTTEFPEGAEDSRLEVVLTSRGGGETEIVFLHTNLPEGDGHKYEDGWIKHYLTPMRAYFNRVKAKKEAAEKAPKPEKPAKVMKAEKPAKVEKPAKTEKVAKAAKVEKAVKTIAKAAKTIEKAQKTLKPAKAAKAAKKIAKKAAPTKAKGKVAKGKVTRIAPKSIARGVTKKAAAKTSKAKTANKRGAKRSKSR